MSTVQVLTGPRSQRERGGINLGLLFISMIFTIFVVMGIAGVAVATNKSQDNQNAADASALAAAEAYERAGLLYFAPGFSNSAELRSKVKVAGVCPVQVRSSAAQYASKNGSRLVTCRMLEWGGVEVSTEAEVPLDGARDSVKAARATWDLHLDNCIVDPAFVAPVTGVGFTWMQCGSDRFDLKYASGRYFLHPWGQVKQAMEPKLTQ